MLIQAELIGLVREIESMRGDRSAEAEAAREVVREKIKLIGRTAAFFGGFDGMTKLHNAVEEMTGNRNEIGDVLNRTWDGIGGWWA